MRVGVHTAVGEGDLVAGVLGVEMIGFEPTTPWLQTKVRGSSSNCDSAEDPATTCVSCCHWLVSFSVGSCPSVSDLCPVGECPNHRIAQCAVRSPASPYVTANSV